MELLDEMRMDMANFLVQQIRPQIMQQSVSYERKKFIEFLESQKSRSTNLNLIFAYFFLSFLELGNIDGFEYTRKWLKSNYDSLSFSKESKKEIVNRVLTSAYSGLLIWDKNIQENFPETLLLDQKRIIALQDFFFLNILVGSILLFTVAAFPAIQNHNDFREKLRDHLLVMIGEFVAVFINQKSSNHLTKNILFFLLRHQK